MSSIHKNEQCAILEAFPVIRKPTCDTVKMQCSAPTNKCSCLLIHINYFIYLLNSIRLVILYFIFLSKPKSNRSYRVLPTYPRPYLAYSSVPQLSIVESCGSLKGIIALGDKFRHNTGTVVYFESVPETPAAGNTYCSTKYI